MIDDRSALVASPRHAVALDCIEAGIERALPERVVATSVRLDGNVLSVGETAVDLTAYSAIVVVGGGKGAGQLAAAIEGLLGDRIETGVVVTDAVTETTHIEQVEAAHPVPDERGQAGGARVLETVRDADAETLILAAITGGGSALLPAPAGEVGLADLQAVTDRLVRSGATIEEINAVRKHLSATKGGRLAQAAAPARVVGLVISDVVGNRLDVIASGPLSPDPSTYDEAQAVLRAYDIAIPDSVRRRLTAGAAGDVSETPTAGDEAFSSVSVQVLVDGLAALHAAAGAAADHGYDPIVLSSRIRGEARESAKTHVGIAAEIAASGTPIEPPAVVLTGGETTVRVEGNGEGGPNQEFALSGAIELDESEICLAAVDTDGIDGSTAAAGAIVTSADGTPTAAAHAALRANDANSFLAGTGSLIHTGPTGTNVNDLRVLVVGE